MSQGGDKWGKTRSEVLSWTEKMRAGAIRVRNVNRPQRFQRRVASRADGAMSRRGRLARGKGVEENPGRGGTVGNPGERGNKAQSEIKRHGLEPGSID